MFSIVLINKSRSYMYNWFYIVLLLVSTTQAYNQSPGEQLSQYTSGFHTEKIYTHTDKEYYLPDETIYGKIYHIHGQDHSLIDTAVVVHIELWSEEDKLVRQLRTKTHKGMAAFSINTDLGLNPGVYHLKVYTQYQKNFDSAYLFQKEIRLIYNPAELDELSNLDSDSIFVDFFPEGGYLVNNLKSRVAFRSTDEKGKAIYFKGSIYDDLGNLLIEIEPELHGYGSFDIEPQEGRTYHLVTEYQGQEIQFDLPNSLEQGSIVYVNNDTSYTQVFCYLSEAYQNKINTIVAHIRGEVLMEYNFEQHTQFKLLPKDLPSGVIHLTIFDEQANPIAERLIYSENPEEKGNLDIELQTDSLTTLNKISSRISAPLSADTSNIHASVSIRSNDLFEQKYRGIDIRSYLLIQSDLKGKIEHLHDFYLSDTTGNNHLDLLMMTHGWRRFDWLEILEGKKREILYPPQFSTSIAGQVSLLRNNKPVKSDLLLTAMNEDLFTTQTLTTTENGLFVFSGIDLTDTTEIIIQAAKHKAKKKKDEGKLGLTGNRLVDIELIELNTPDFKKTFSIAEQFYAPPLKKTVQEPQRTDSKVPKEKNQNQSTVFDNSLWSIELEDFVVKSSAINNAQRKSIETKKAYRERNMVFFSSTEKFDPTEEQFKSFEFKTIHQMISQIIPTAKLIYRDGYPRIVYGRFSAQAEPKLFLDGEPLGPDRAFILDPYNIAMIDVWVGLRAEMVYDTPLAIILLSKDPEQVKKTPVKGLINLSYPAYHQSKTFSYTEPISWSTGLPDKRTTLYWNPYVTISPDMDLEFSFFSSDIAGEFIMDIQGISDDGILYSEFIPFTIDASE